VRDVGGDPPNAWNEFLFINKWVNDTVKPMTDLEHHGVAEKWACPNDGYGDCEDYVLAKRRILIEAGWPREALLITVVSDKNGVGHAVLTVISVWSLPVATSTRPLVTARTHHLSHETPASLNEACYW